MNKNLITSALLFWTLAFTQVASAYKKTEGTTKFQDITLTESVEMDEFENLKLKQVAHGLRNKKVAFMNFKVYVAEILLPATATWNKNPDQILTAPEAAVQMTFLREVPAKNIMDAFQDSLKENQVDVASEPVKNFLDTVKKIGNIADRDVFTVARKKSDKGDQVALIIPGKFKEVVSGPAGWSDGILKIWAGKPADAGLKALQKELF